MFTPAIDAALLASRPSQFSGMTPDLCLPADPVEEMRRKILEQNAATPPSATADADMEYFLRNAVA